LNNNNRNNRRRGRGNRSQGGNGNQLNRIDSRARGNAPQMLEKYKKLAQDAQHNGDRVQMEYYLQFADHYFRVIADNKARQDEQRGGRRNDERDQNDDVGDDDNDFDRGRRGERNERNDRNDRSQRPRRDDRDGDSRGNDDLEYGQEGETFLGDDEGEEAAASENESRAEPRPEPRRRQQRKPQGEAQGDKSGDKRTERKDAKPARGRKPRKAADDDRGGIDSSILPPSIRGDDAGDGAGDSDGTLEAVG
jgi:hypothetical protein